MYTTIGLIFIYSLTWIHIIIAGWRFFTDSKEYFNVRYDFYTQAVICLSLFINILLFLASMELNSPFILLALLNFMFNILLIDNDSSRHYTISDVTKLFVKEGK